MSYVVIPCIQVPATISICDLYAEMYWPITYLSSKINIILTQNSQLPMCIAVCNMTAFLAMSCMANLKFFSHHCGTDYCNCFHTGNESTCWNRAGEELRGEVCPFKKPQSCRFSRYKASPSLSHNYTGKEGSRYKREGSRYHFCFVCSGILIQLVCIIDIIQLVWHQLGRPYS